MIRIGVDLSSAEKDSIFLFSSVIEFLKECSDVCIVVFIEDTLRLEITEKYPFIFERCSIIYTHNDIKMEDIPSTVLIEKKASAIVSGLTYLSENKIDAFFSPGNSGALLLLAKEIIKLREEVSFPAVGLILPRLDDQTLILDVGANLSLDDNRVLELVFLGLEYYQKNFPNVHPQIGLLNIGKEPYKGSLVLKRMDRFLKKSLKSYYVGFMEGMDIFKSSTNIFITDAYTGNILLKSWEGFLSYIFIFLQREFFSKKLENHNNSTEDVLSFLKNNFHYSQIGAAPILGLKKPVFLGHGRTSSKALLGALRHIKKYLEIGYKSSSEVIYKKKRSEWAKNFNKKDTI